MNTSMSQVDKKTPPRGVHSWCHQTSRPNSEAACEQYGAADREDKGEAAINESVEARRVRPCARRLACCAAKVRLVHLSVTTLMIQNRTRKTARGEERLASHRQKLGGQLQRAVTMPTGGGPFYKKPLVCYFT